MEQKFEITAVDINSNKRSVVSNILSLEEAFQFLKDSKTSGTNQKTFKDYKIENIGKAKVTITNISTTLMSERYSYDLIIPYNLAALTSAIEYIAAWDDVSFAGTDVEEDKFRIACYSNTGHLKGIQKHIWLNS